MKKLWQRILMAFSKKKRLAQQEAVYLEVVILLSTRFQMQQFRDGLMKVLEEKL